MRIKNGITCGPVTSPDAVLDKSDPGDDVSARFDYQHSYAAINAIRLITGEGDISEVICENHEDYLLKNSAGKFIGTQIKTRKITLPPFKAGDPQVTDALGKFCVLDQKFSGCFEGFDFTTNHAFWENEQSLSNLPWLLAALRQRGSVKGLRANNPLRQFVEGIASSTGLSHQDVATTLIRTTVRGHESEITHIRSNVQEALCECLGIEDLPYATVAAIAKAVVQLARDASAKALRGPITELFAPGTDLKQAVDDQLLAGKRICKSDARHGSFGHWPLDRTRPADSIVLEAAELIASARAPVAIAGGGAISPAAVSALARLQETAHLPVFTTNMGKGAVNEFHPLSGGVLGSLTGPRSLGRHTKPILDEADVVVLIGTRTNQNGTDSWRHITPGTRVIHIDVDPAEIGRNYEALRLTGDAAATLEALCAAIESSDLSRRRAGRTRIEERIATAWTAFEADRASVAGSNRSPIRPERVMKELQTRLTPETIVTADASYSSMWILGQLRAGKAGQRFITPRGLAGLGWGLPLAVGAKVARPEAPVVALVGDGGFAHSWAELETMVRSDVPVTVIVLNNGILGYQKDAETVKFGTYTSACHFAPVDHAAIARACGCGATVVAEPGDIGSALDEALAADRPWLIEILTAPDAHPPLSLYDGTLDVSDTGPTHVEAAP